MSLFPRSFISNEFAPVFRFIDDYASHVASSRGTGFTQALSNTLRTFQPRFDVKEETDKYVLQGELPGIDHENINVEWADNNTLTIKGRSERVREEGSRPSASIENQAPEQRLEAEDDSHQYRKPTVEDEGTAAASSDQDSTGSTEEVKEGETEAQEVAQQQQPKSDGSHYWISERSVGNFARTFSFPNRVDQDHVTASLKNGILSVIIPKAPAPVNKQITIE